MLSKSGLSKKFWGEALLTATYLVNRSPSMPLVGQCPEYVFYGKPLVFSHLRVFGCTAFVHNKSDKLEPRSRKGVFLGYPEGVKGYRVWLRDEPGFKVIISRDVVFNEDEFPCLRLTLSPDPIDVDNEPLTEVESRATLTGVEHPSGAPSEVEQPFWNTYPVYTPNETLDEGNPKFAA